MKKIVFCYFLSSKSFALIIIEITTNPQRSLWLSVDIFMTAHADQHANLQIKSLNEKTCSLNMKYCICCFNSDVQEFLELRLYFNITLY